MRWQMKPWRGILAGIMLMGGTLYAGDELPAQFDLRAGANSRVTSVKEQSGGTCWTHAVMAAIESNLLISGGWDMLAMEHEPNLAEYHLDWWNGFNMFHNADIPAASGMEVHEGGDYLVATAYMARGEGMVYAEAANDGTEQDLSWFYQAPLQKDASYVIQYARDVAWLQAGSGLDHIDDLKRTLMQHGVMGTCICYTFGAYNKHLNTFYCNQEQLDPNHAVAIVGWDDNKMAYNNLGNAPPGPGAWLAKNSWGSDWGDEGYFWVSYYDAHCGKHPEMGAVSYQSSGALPFDRIYSWDYHGWRDTMPGCQEAFNAFTSEEASYLKAVSFYTAADNVEFTCRIYNTYNGDLQNLLAEKSGTLLQKGFHTIDLDDAVNLTEGEDFYVYVFLSEGGHPFDRTSQVDVLLGGESSGVVVLSSGARGQSYFRDGSMWKDIQDYQMDFWPSESANFCIKAMTVMSLPSGAPDSRHPADHRLQGNYPNPFNPSTTIRFELKTAAVVDMTVMNLMGQTVRHLIGERRESGIHEVVWDGTDDRGIHVSSGPYFVRFKAGARLQIHKMILMR